MSINLINNCNFELENELPYNEDSQSKQGKSENKRRTNISNRIYQAGSENKKSSKLFSKRIDAAFRGMVKGTKKKVLRNYFLIILIHFSDEIKPQTIYYLNHDIISIFNRSENSALETLNQLNLKLH
jgi:hypothetical protein